MDFHYGEVGASSFISQGGRLRIRSLPRWIFWVGPAAFLGVFLLLPLGTIFLAGAGAPDNGYGWADILPVLRFTVWQAALSTFLTLLLGLPGAYLFGCWDFPGKRFLRILAFIPFILPTMVAAAGMEAWLGAHGWVNLLLARAGLPAPIPFTHTLGAILLAHIFYNTSIVLRVVGSAWERMDPHLVEAARVLGAGRLSAFLRISLPLLLPSILAASLLVFFFDFSSFGVILLLGGPSFATLEVEIYIQALNLLDLRAAAWLAGLQILCTMILSVISAWLSAQAEPHTAHRPNLLPPRRLQSTRGWMWAGLILGALTILLIMPLAAPLARSFLILTDGRWTVSLQYYLELGVNRRGSAFFVPPMDALRNSLLAASATACITLGLALPAAASLARPTRWERFIEPIWMLPLGTSAVVLGLGMLLSYGKISSELVSSPVLLPIAHSLVAFPFVLRSLRPALAAIPPRLREAAVLLGASPWQVWRMVDLPLAARAVASAAAFAFAISLGEFGATSLLTRPDFPTLPVVIFRFLAQPGGLNYGQAMASATILLVLCGLLVGIMDLGRDINAHSAQPEIIL
jgi:thiamine transport system permease protein